MFAQQAKEAGSLAAYYVGKSSVYITHALVSVHNMKYILNKTVCMLYVISFFNA